MQRLFGGLAAFVLGSFLACSGARAECSGDFVAGNAGGTWQVNNAGGEGFGGWFLTEDGAVVHEDKPTVGVGVGDGTLSIGSSGPIGIGNFHDEDNPNGGTWCAFTLGDYSARIAHADNGWWIFEVGNYEDRNKIELIRK